MAKGSISFFRTFFKHRKMVGAVSPSSPFLMRKMLGSIDFNKARLLIELGPGTGVFTRKILESMHEDCILLAFELNDHFVAKLSESITDKRFKIIHDSAEKITEYLKEFDLPKADYIISSLPLTAIPSEIRNNIINNSYEALKPEGEYIQFQYSLHQRKNLKSVYKSQSILFTPLNIPPAFVYICKK